MPDNCRVRAPSLTGPRKNGVVAFLIDAHGYGRAQEFAGRVRNRAACLQDPNLQQPIASAGSL